MSPLQKRIWYGAGILLHGLFIHLAVAQVPAQRFTLTSCPQVTGVDKAAFNAQYGDLPSLTEYILVLRRTFPGDKGCCTVSYSMVRPTDVLDLVYHIPTQKTRVEGLVSLSSKGAFYSTLEGRREVRAVLRDTIAVWDTLRLRMRLLDADLPTDGYRLIWTDPQDGRPYMTAVPVRGDTLLLSAALFGERPMRYVPVELRHRSESTRTLADFTLHIVPSVERDALLELVCRNADRTALDRREQQSLLHQYCEDWYGRIPLDQLPAPDCDTSPHR